MKKTTNRGRASADSVETASKKSSGSTSGARGDRKRPYMGKLVFASIAVVAIALVAWLIWQPTPPPPIVKKFEGNLPTKPDTVKKVTIVLDNSISMAGYANGNAPAFISAMSDLRSIYPNTDAVYYDADGNECHLAGDEFINALRLHTIAYRGESLLHKDLARIANQVDSSKNVLMLYVTDGIMSFSNGDIVKDRSRNITFSDELRNKVADAFRGKKNVGVSVYQLNSSFSGTYYCYNNDTVTLNETPRYYYVVAVGNLGALANLKQKVEDLKGDPHSRFNSSDEWHCIERGTLSDGLESGTLTAVGKDFAYNPERINKNMNGQMDFSISHDMFKNFSLNFDILAEYTHIIINDRPANVSVINDNAQHKFKFTLSLKSRNYVVNNGTTVRIYTDYIEPAWVSNCSTDNDEYMKNPTQRDAKTFLLDRFIEGIQKGLRGTGNKSPIYDRTFTLFRKNS